MSALQASLHRALASGRTLAERHHRHLLSYRQWLPPQHQFLGTLAEIALLRGGNQTIGKSEVGAAECIYYATGHHPLKRTPKRPVEIWVLCASWSQSLAMQAKLVTLCPKHLLHPSTIWDPATGIRGKSPVLRVQSRHGGWSIIRIKTTNQDALDLAGATIDLALFDEPPRSARLFGEVQKRVLRKGGRVVLTLTPINAPTDWLRELTLTTEQGDAPVVLDIHARLTPEVMVPVGTDRPLRVPTRDGGTRACDEAWIAELERKSLPHEVPVVVHGEWEMRAVDRVFTAFRESGPEPHVNTSVPSGQVDLQLGLDHGSGRNFSSYAALTAVKRPRPGEYARTWVIDEYASEGETTEEEDARQIVAMLKRHGQTWGDLHRVFGDRPWGGRGARLQRKSNDRLHRAIGKVLGRRRLPEPGIQTVKRGQGHGAGSVHVGCRYFHSLMLRAGHFNVHPRCKRLILSMNRWDFTDSEYKHAIDGLRYSQDNHIFGRYNRAMPRVYMYG